MHPLWRHSARHVVGIGSHSTSLCRLSLANCGSRYLVSLGQTPDPVNATFTIAADFTHFLPYFQKFGLWVRPLSAAIIHGHTETALFLIEHTGFNVPLEGLPVEERQAVVLDLAILFRRHHIVPALVDRRPLQDATQDAFGEV